MSYLEVIYETGEHSIMEAADKEAALAALQIQHERAKNGLPGGPTGHPAVRIVRVIEYENHPADYGASQNVSADEAKARFNEALKAASEGSVVNMAELESELREVVYPMVNSDPHESNYKMEGKEVKLEWL